MKKIYFVLAMSLAACQEQNPEDKALNKASSGDASPSDFSVSDAAIKKLRYDRATHSLIADLEYGGCGEAKHKLDEVICLLSYPPQCGGKLIRPKDFNSACDKLNFETMTYPLDENFTIGNFNISNQKGDRVEVFVEKTPKGAPSIPDVVSSAEIKSLTYDRGTHSLKLQLTYGGCAEAKHSLRMGDACGESFPLQCSAKIVHPSDFDGSCKKLIEETLSYPLESTFDQASLRVTNAEGNGLSVLIDKKGNSFPPIE